MDQSQAQESGDASEKTGASETDQAESSGDVTQSADVEQPNAELVQVGLVSVPPSHAAYFTLVPLRAGRFPFLSWIAFGMWGQITVEDPAAEPAPES